jgi:hypothetical protein
MMFITPACVQKILAYIDAMPSSDEVYNFFDALVATEAMVDKNPDLGGFLSLTDGGAPLFYLCFGRRSALIYAKSRIPTMIDMVDAIEVL